MLMASVGRRPCEIAHANNCERVRKRSRGMVATLQRMACHVPSAVLMLATRYSVNRFYTNALIADTNGESG